MTSLLLMSDNINWLSELKAHLPNIYIQHYPEITKANEIEFALVWNPKKGVLAKLTNLKVIFSIGAGVDHILRDESIPKEIPIIRMSDPFQYKMVAEYALLTVLYVHRNIETISKNNNKKVWTEQTAAYTPEYTVGVLGLGNIGSVIVDRMQSIGFSVLGWSRSKKILDGVETFSGFRELETMLPRCDYLICALPLTQETKGIINKASLSLMKKDSTLINIGRGEHIEEEALLSYIDKVPLKKVFLDVFPKEPLEKSHSFWNHPKIFVTPHMAGEVLPKSAVFSVKKGIDRFKNGEPLQNIYDRKKGY